MAIELVYEGADGQYKSVPIATFDDYSRMWVQGARELGLTAVPRLMHGVKLDPDGVRALVTELSSLSGWAKQRAQADLFDRVDTLAAELQRLLDAGVKDYSFG